MLEVIKVFFYFIRFLKDYLMEEIKKCMIIQEVEGEVDLEYVLIVLVIWGDKVKMFMREVVVGVRLVKINGVKKFGL